MLHTRICELFEIEHPVVSAPMAGVATAELAAAVSDAGGLGLIGAGAGSPDWLRDRGTDSLWDLSGKAVEGPLAGTSLTYVSSFIAEWYGWSAYHPETTIYEG